MQLRFKNFSCKARVIEWEVNMAIVEVAVSINVPAYSYRVSMFNDLYFIKYCLAQSVTKHHVTHHKGHTLLIYNMWNNILNTLS